MREILVVFITYTISYSLLLLVVIMLIVFLCFFIESKKCIGSRQYAWEQNKLILSSHQRLNVEHPNILKIYDHSRSINRSKYYENKDNFHQ